MPDLLVNHLHAVRIIRLKLKNLKKKYSSNYRTGIVAVLFFFKRKKNNQNFFDLNTIYFFVNECIIISSVLN